MRSAYVADKQMLFALWARRSHARPMSNERYTHGHVEPVMRSHRWRTAENSAAYLLPHLAPGTSLLDVGCGPGNITVDLADRVAPGRVSGVDASAEAVDMATHAYAASHPEVSFEVADVYALPYADGTFDVVHAHQVLQHLADPSTALAEMARVTRPGGLVAARDADYGAFTWYPADPALDAWRAMYTAVTRANAGEANGGRHLLAWAHAVGLHDVAATATAWCFAEPDDRAWWGGLWADRSTASPLAERALELGIATADELQAMADGWHRWADHPDGWFVVPHGEILVRVPR
jgi:2-polyprenyl-3-methyl-5-hydroxy-6-metoxy-1,4-benzoquinol methylase